MPKVTLSNTAYDIHPFDPDSSGPVTLAGLQIDSEHALKAHSDGDVLIHAIVDAILGILAIPEKRDIGSIFPDNDPQWKNASSDIFLNEAINLAQQQNTDLIHINVQLACKTPRLSAHYEAMVKSLSKISGLKPQQINVQAMSGNGCGPEGRGEAISARASVTMIKAHDE